MHDNITYPVRARQRCARLTLIGACGALWIAAMVMLYPISDGSETHGGPRGNGAICRTSAVTPA